MCFYSDKENNKQTAVKPAPYKKSNTGYRSERQEINRIDYGVHQNGIYIAGTILKAKWNNDRVENWSEKRNSGHHIQRW